MSSSNKKKAPPNFKEWEKLTAQLEEKFAAMEIQQNLKEHYKTAGSQLLTEEQEKEKKNIPSELDILEKEIPALQEKITEVENKINGKSEWKDWFNTEKKKLKKAKEKKYPAKKKAPEKKEETPMINLPKEGDKTLPLEILPPHVGLGLATTGALKRHLARQAQVRKETKNKQVLGESSPYQGQENLREYGSPSLPSDTRNMHPMQEYGYSPGVHQTSGDFGDDTKYTLGGKRRKKKSRRRRRTKKKKSRRRRKKKTRKKRKKRKRRRRTKKN